MHRSKNRHNVYPDWTDRLRYSKPWTSELSRIILSRSARNDNTRTCYTFRLIIPLRTPLQNKLHYQRLIMSGIRGGLTGSIYLQYSIVPTGPGLWPPQKRVSPPLTLRSSPQLELRKWFSAYFWSDKWYAQHSIPHASCLQTYKKLNSHNGPEASTITPRA